MQVHDFTFVQITFLVFWVPEQAELYKISVKYVLTLIFPNSHMPYLSAWRAMLTLGTREARGTNGAPLSLWTHNTCCPLNTL